LLADLILQLLVDRPEGGVVQLASAEEACGAYGRVVVAPDHHVEARMFGWPRLTPGDEYEAVSAIAAMLRLGFVYDGTDWIWSRPFLPALVPVAAHAASRAMAEAWEIVEGTSSELLVSVHLLTNDEIAGIVDGSRCERCANGCGRVDHEEAE